MIWKLSMTGIKSRLRDYMILFSGLAVASAIFYMFQSIATNKAFLESSNTVKMAAVIFQFGTVLLGIITVVYILYANSFLMTLRQKTYAMLMMLGAKTKKIAQIIFLETFIIGIAATFIGTLVGIGLTSLVNSLLVNQLDITVQHFSPFNVSAMIWTFVFFGILFIVTAFINAGSIVKKPILQLLKEQTMPKTLKIRPILLFLETVIGIISLGIGYYMLAHINKYQLFGIAIALVTIVLGSYLLFHAIAIFVLSILKSIDAISMKKLNNFTLSQLTFRIRDYTQILTMVAILFAMAMGAITVGLGFRSQTLDSTNKAATYDLVLNNAQKIDKTQINQLNPTVNDSYSQKEDDKTLYYNEEQFNERPLQNKDYQTQKVISYTGQDMLNDPNILENLRWYGTPEQQAKDIKLVSAEDFNQLDLPEASLELVSVSNFKESLLQIKKLVEENTANNPSLATGDGFNQTAQKYVMYQISNSLYSGFQFMGFFLGLAFLTMLASCLMFKILSSANTDKARFQMLRKIGTRPSLLKGAVRKEIGVLFLLPGILGVIHVLFGLQMFKELMSDPYHGIWIPFSIFIFLYAIYYVLTVVIYSSIVLPKENN
ncbi:FtsX-like permease family protein [Vagococcus luciliae]|uniref:Bacitracin export permease protein BceB n=1 Tax=Vagococcus luciliae TaxID=2920380 RepID=A0ABY5NWX4_9ENTE|nr:ABC transporter permease [Vagococcus luciliae]UUV98147.1 Bacitracin export permease protein BceB [Vagococcus luciliae]